ncbi:MAG: gamma-glutamyltransferase, partial [Actinobacteria bacterium]|nr:gamma-glutamyltransferase [Actinomycetota bacterium]NIT95411.1 gamma-glutamyltransferase [Actinomycetota bacterium]NIU19098.1 gamma-glutamyltransferase [Actinomycetota bacterium]NIU66159.1 gamma-glutamyltransferase [Actinomycetota bacterium]NIV55584.1 gamma-glutamyltransferase [Actinomycetota bacterium]
MAVRIGVDLLRRGGSAVDAAIAANAALGFLEPTACGIGGDLFAIVWDAADGRLHAVDGSGRAPRALTAERVRPDDDGTIPLFSPFSWTVPGAVDAWFELHDTFGRLPMADVLAPAIESAEEGEPVPRVIAAEWQEAATTLRDKPGFASTFLPGGESPREGQPFRNPRLAAAYRLLATDGRDAFYRGPIARTLVAFSEKHGGFFQLEDLADHRSDRITPISTSYRDVEVFELPPAGQG